MPSEKPRINFITDPILIKKIKFIANQNDRSMSKEIERLCKLHILEYEKQHGELKIE